MPPVAVHCQSSQSRLGIDFLTLHEWIDNDPQHKAARHDLTQVLSLAGQADAIFGFGAGRELVMHLLDDLKAKLGHALPPGPELDAVKGVLAQLGIE